MTKVKFEKSYCSHGIVLNAFDWSNNCVATYYPLYKECHIYDKEYVFLKPLMKAVHFDHQFDEIERFQELHNFRNPNQKIHLIS